MALVDWCRGKKKDDKEAIETPHKNDSTITDHPDQLRQRQVTKQQEEEEEDCAS
jgi:hypothetical protein